MERAIKNAVTGKVWTLADANGELSRCDRYKSFDEWVLFSPVRIDDSRYGGEVIVFRVDDTAEWEVMGSEAQGEYLSRVATIRAQFFW